MSKTNDELENNIDLLTFALGFMIGAVATHKLDIEDEAFVELMEELNNISSAVLSKL